MVSFVFLQESQSLLLLLPIVLDTSKHDSTYSVLTRFDMSTKLYCLITLTFEFVLNMLPLYMKHITVVKLCILMIILIPLSTTLMTAVI